MANQLPPGFRIVNPQTTPQVDLPEGFQILETPNTGLRNIYGIPSPGQVYNTDIVTGLKKGAQRLPGLVAGIPGDIGRLGVAGEELVRKGVGKAASVVAGKPVTLPKAPSMIPGPFEALSMLPGSSEIIGATESMFGAAPSPASPAGRSAQLGVEFLPMAFGPRSAIKGAEVATRTIPQKVYDTLKGVGSRAKAVAIPTAAVTGAEYATQGTALEPYAEVAGLVAGSAIASPGRAASVMGKGGIGTEALKTATDNAFTKLRQSGITYKRKALNDLVSSIENKFGRGAGGMQISDVRQPKSASLVNDLKKLRSSKVDWTDLNTIRQEASDIASTFTDEMRSERKFANEIIKAIDEFHDKPVNSTLLYPSNVDAETVGSLTKDAFSLNRRQAKTRTIESMINTSVAGKGENAADAANRLRGSFQRLADRIAQGKAKGWTADEVKAINSLAKGNYESDALNTLSKLGADTSPLGMLRTATYGATIGIPMAQDMSMLIPIAAGAIAAPATVARGLGPRVAQTRGQQVRNLIAAGPAGQQQANRVAAANRLRQAYGVLQAPGLLDEDRR